MTVEVLTRSPEETEQIAAALAARLVPGDVVLICGELGAGKTTFVRGACRALGVTERVTSPTFTIGHFYEGRVRISHLDLYRFTGFTASDWGDLESYFDGVVAFVEWPEAGITALPEPRVTVTIEHVEPSTRRLRLDAQDARVVQGIADAPPTRP